MKLQEGRGGAAGTLPALARARSVGDAQEEADKEIAQEQAAELLCKFGRLAIQQS
jgi:hypothetical protein